MGVIERAKDILASNMNALLEKAENPSKMAELEYRRAVEDLAEAKKETARLMGLADVAKQDYEAAKKDYDSYDGSIKNAISSGREDAARTMIEEMQKKAPVVESAKLRYDTAKEAADQMQAVYNKLNDNIAICQARMQNIKAMNAQAQAQESANKVAERLNKTAQGTNMSRMEQKAQERLAAANAESRLNGVGLDGRSEAERLRDQFATSAGSQSVDDTLAAYKKQMGLS